MAVDGLTLALMALIAARTFVWADSDYVNAADVMITMGCGDACPICR